jgi:hypothetical protein
MSAMGSYVWIEMPARAHTITPRTIALFVDVESVFLIWLEATDCPRDQNRISQLFEGHGATD